MSRFIEGADRGHQVCRSRSNRMPYRKIAVDLLQIDFEVSLR